MPQKTRSHDFVTWESRLYSASTERELVSIAREFMAQFTPAEISAVPEGCRPGKIVDADDIARCAVELARYECQGDGVTVISKLNTFFSSAANRVSQIHAGTPNDRRARSKSV